MNLYDTILKNTRRFFGMDSEASEAEVDQKLEEAGTVEAMKATLKKEVEAEMQTEIDDEKAKNTTLETANTGLTKEVKDLKADLKTAKEEIEELKKEPGEKHTGGETSEEGKKKEKSWMKNPINMKAAGFNFNKKESKSE